jgi:hypothetical protein
MGLRIAPNLENAIASRFDYELKIIYLGNEVLKTDPDDPEFNERYRTRFDMIEMDGDREVDADEEVPDKEKDKKWQIVVHDNHALHADDSNTLLGPGGDTESKPANYVRRDWERDIRPGVPFKVEVRKKEGDENVEIKLDELLIGWKVLDPEEEHAVHDKPRNPARPKQWMKDFFKTYKRETNSDTSKEDDNCSDQFNGFRGRDGKLVAGKLLFESPFDAGSPKPLPGQKDEVKSKVVPDDDDNTLGVSEVFFFPPAIGGNNYKFELTLLPKKGNPKRFKNTADKIVEKYETIPFTMWRQVTIDLLVTFNSVDESYVNWDDVTNAYHAAFIRIKKPEGSDHVVKYDEATWKQVVKDYFRNDVGSPNATTIDNNTYYDYNNHLLPKYPGSTLPAGDRATDGTPKQNWFWTPGAALARKFLAKAYTDKGKKNPRTEDAVQDEAPGLFMFFGKHLYPGSGALGMYMGHREFFMVERGDATCTFAHELGHAVFLRHAMVKFDSGAKVCIDKANSNWLDHDQKDSLICLMAYENDYYGSDGKTKRTSGAVEWHFCSMCLLKLRYWDTVKMQKNSVIKGRLLEGLKPIKITRSNYAAIGGSLSMAKNAHLDFAALAEGESSMNNMGGPFKKDLSTAKGGKWVCDKRNLADFVTYSTANFKGRLKGKNAGTGSVKVHFEFNGIKSQTITVNLT